MGSQRVDDGRRASIKCRSSDDLVENYPHAPHYLIILLLLLLLHILVTFLFQKVKCPQRETTSCQMAIFTRTGSVMSRPGSTSPPERSGVVRTGLRRPPASPPGPLAS